MPSSPTQNAPIPKKGEPLEESEPSPDAQKNIPAHKLEGLELANGWKVVKKHIRTDGLSGGKYSVGYFVERGSQKGFLKAIDYSRAAKEANVPQALLELVESFQFERTILETCSAKRMDRVISPLEDGEVTVDSSLWGRVNYLIFDVADGDIRKTLAQIDTFELTRRLKILHHVATGMYQLHKAGVAHQDLKPSNVLSFGEISKVSDLGSGSVKGRPGPRDGEKCKGTKSYAPLELLYDQIDPEFNVRRFGCDCYLLGSFVVFTFSGVGITCGTLSHLAEEHRPTVWSGTYAEVLPYVEDAFGLAVSDFSSEIRNAKLRGELTTIVRQLCEPNPSRRGHPDTRRQRVGNPYSLERYVNWFNLLATRAALGLIPQEK